MPGKSGCEICGAKDDGTWRRCKLHDCCDDCGSRDGLCSYVRAVLCRGCWKKRSDAQVESFDDDTSYEQEAVCPHCGDKGSDSWEMSDGEYECEWCEREYEVFVNVEVTYSTKKVDS